MTCNYCTETATAGGRAPVGTGGLRYIVACGKHAPRIESLKYIPMPVAEIESILRREAKEAKK